MSFDLAAWLRSLTDGERYRTVSQQPHLADALLDEIERLRVERDNLREVSFAYVRLQAERGAT